MSAETNTPTNTSTNTSTNTPTTIYAWKILRPPYNPKVCGQAITRNYSYYPRRWNYPTEGYGPLCAFDTWENAYDFGLLPLDKLYLCAVTLSSEICVWTRYGGSVPRLALPTGTLLCSRIKCLIRVRVTRYSPALGTQKIPPYRAISVAEAQRRIAEDYYHLQRENTDNGKGTA